jgi:hypothetical protein
VVSALPCLEREFGVRPPIGESWQGGLSTPAELARGGETSIATVELPTWKSWVRGAAVLELDAVRSLFKVLRRGLDVIAVVSL